MNFGAAYLASAALEAALVVAVPAAAQETDWTKRVTLSAQGGHIMGNPLAKHTLAEYMSYTCNHCANFDAQSYRPLKSQYISAGHLNFEVRNLILNPIDLTAAMLARCGGRTKFFGNHRAFLTQQATWLTKFQSSTPEVIKSLGEGTVPERLKKIAKAAGFYGLMKKRGYSAGQVNACLSNKAEQDTILEMTEHATKTLKITGTPGFVLNGKTVSKVHDWNNLQPKLAVLPR